MRLRRPTQVASTLEDLADLVAGQRVDAPRSGRAPCTAPGARGTADERRLVERRRPLASGTTNAHGTSPRRSSGRPTTATSATSGDRRSTSSTSPGCTFIPPRLIMSDTRPSIHRKPSASTRPMSPVRNQPSALEPIGEVVAVGAARSPGCAPRARPRRRLAALDRRRRSRGSRRRGAAARPRRVASRRTPRVGRAPADDLAADLGLPVAVEQAMPKRSRNRRACSGDSGAVIERTNFSGASDVTDSSSLSIAIAAGGSTVDRIAEPLDEPGELGRFEAVHQHHRARRPGRRTARCRSRPTATARPGSRFGIGGVRRSRGPRRPAAWRAPLSSSSSTPQCRSSTGFGAPVVPDVNCTRAHVGGRGERRRSSDPVPRRVTVRRSPMRLDAVRVGRAPASR